MTITDLVADIFAIEIYIGILPVVIEPHWTGRYPLIGQRIDRPVLCPFVRPIGFGVRDRPLYEIRIAERLCPNTILHIGREAADTICLAVGMRVEVVVYIAREKLARLALGNFIIDAR